MLILLYGPDSYRRERRVKEIIDDFRSKSPEIIFNKFNLKGQVANGNGLAEFMRLKEFAVNRSILADKKLALLEKVWSPEENGRGDKTKKSESSPRSYKEIKKFLEDYAEDADFIAVISESKSPPAALKFLLEESASVEEFTELAGQKLKSFIRKTAEEKGINLDSSAVDFLADFFGPDTWAIVTEIRKLRWLKLKKPLTPKDLKRVGDYPDKENIFSFINLFGYGKGEVRTKIIALEKLFFSREEPAMIFNILATRPFLSPELFRSLADYDVTVKAGRLDYEEVLLNLALN